MYLCVCLPAQRAVHLGEILSLSLSLRIHLSLRQFVSAPLILQALHSERDQCVGVFPTGEIRRRSARRRVVSCKPAHNTKTPSAQRANICATPIWRAACARVPAASWWASTCAANEARDVALLWKRRGLTSILKRRVFPPPSDPPRAALLFSTCTPRLLLLLLLLLPGLRRSTSASCSIQSSKLDEAPAADSPGSGRATLKR